VPRVRHLPGRRRLLAVASVLGEHTTKALQAYTGITHGVEWKQKRFTRQGWVWRACKKDGWIEGLGPGSRLEIQVREPSTMHSLTVQQFHHWIDGVTTSRPKSCDAHAWSSCWEGRPPCQL
jgi:hypothetical protein